jgi:peptidoglycan/xylan/chitin deacetylase (PgdA/CDA1 family)
MLIRRQDLSVSLFYYLGYSKIVDLLLRLQRKAVARFVTFHDLLPETLGCFEANLHFLKRSTNVVSLDDFFLGTLSSQKINTVITFDDGYKSWVSDAVPILQKLELPATFFVSSGFVGLSKKEEAEFIRSNLFTKLGPRGITGSLSYEDVRRITEEGFTVGGHTLDHCDLADLRDRVQVGYEIGEDKLRLERITGRKVEYFSYPSGAYQNPAIDLIEVLREAGYKGAVTTQSGFNRVGSRPYLLCRELTRASMPGPVFRARVHGNYDAVQFLKQGILAILHGPRGHNGRSPAKI